MSATTYDPWASAEQAKPQNRRYFGHTTMQARPVVLQRGSRPQPFVPSVHRDENRRTQIVVSLAPLPGSKYMDPIERTCLVESNEWVKVVLPALNELGLKPRDFAGGMFAQLEMIPTRDYIKPDGTPGTATVPKVVAIYPSEELCRAAQDATFGRGSSEQPAPATPSAPAAAPATAAGMSPDAQRALLAALWTAAGQNEDQMARLLLATPQFKHLTTKSPEVQEAMAF